MFQVASESIPRWFDPTNSTHGVLRKPVDVSISQPSVIRESLYSFVKSTV